MLPTGPMLPITNEQQADRTPCAQGNVPSERAPNPLQHDVSTMAVDSSALTGTDEDLKEELNRKQ
jgi:hypothetical protein